MAGRVVEKNTELGYAWAAVSAESAQPPAYAPLVRDAIAKQMSHAQLAQAKRWVRAWKVGRDIN